MEQHAIPRQITTFEFKLIGFLTLKQFIYLAVFSGFAVVVYLIFPIPIINLFLAFCTAGAGAALAFVPINERPLDVWVRNFFKKLYGPSQYYYHKKNLPPDFLSDIYLSPSSVETTKHIEASKKLSEYVQSTTTPDLEAQQKAQIYHLISTATITPSKPIIKEKLDTSTTPNAIHAPPIKPEDQKQNKPTIIKDTPFVFGTVLNSKQFPLPNMLLYIQDQDQNPVRILKTNLNGAYATFHPFPIGNYSIKIKDPSGKHIFDTINIEIKNANPQPFNIVSRELL